MKHCDVYVDGERKLDGKCLCSVVMFMLACGLKKTLSIPFDSLDWCHCINIDKLCASLLLTILSSLRLSPSHVKEWSSGAKEFQRIKSQVLNVEIANQMLPSMDWDDVAGYGMCSSRLSLANIIQCYMIYAYIRCDAMWCNATKEKRQRIVGLVVNSHNANQSGQFPSNFPLIFTSAWKEFPFLLFYFFARIIS